MKDRVAVASLLLALTVLAPLPVTVLADGNMDFAESLMAEKDYFRAITELKNIKFFSMDDSTRELCDLKIGEAYLWSNKYDLSISVLGGLLSPGVLDQGRIQEVDILLGLNYFGLRTFPIAQGYFSKALDAGNGFFPLLYLGLIGAETGRWDESESLFAHAIDTTALDSQRALVMELRDTIRRGSALDSRSPFLAGLMSAVIPGAGQMYAGHYVDSAQAFLTVGALSFATYGFYLYDSSRGNSYILTGLGVIVTTLFHAANIYGAVKTADFYNIKQKDDFLGPVREKVFSIQPEIR
jgi:TM2 domain-containing membrane protein YozV